MGLLIIYFSSIIILGFVDFFVLKGFDDFVLAGRRQKSPMVTASLLASIIGASATMAVVNMAYKVGVPAIWWLGSGVIGLFLSAFLLAKKLKSYDVYTLPDLAGVLISSNIKKLISFVIIISWLAVIAAQYFAAASIIHSLTGLGVKRSIWIVAMFVSLYCLLGGQKSVLKSDFLQFILLSAGIIFVSIFLYVKEPIDFSSVNFSLVNNFFKWDSVVYFLFIVGSTYIIGPDIFSRIFTAKNQKVARNSLIFSATILAILNIFIVSIGIWAKSKNLEIGNSGVLNFILTDKLPKWLGLLLSIGLLSAIISSADTCLMTISSSFEIDILGKKNIWQTRILILTLGLLSAIPALFEKNIIGLILIAYKIFNGGIIPIMFIALLFDKKVSLNKIWATISIVVGGAIGVVSALPFSIIQANNKYISLLAMGVGLIFAIISLIFGKKDAS